jgi:tRNA U34 5-methylaminomethyl-2-thiouridine-forming methyltransferase MnmC
VPYLFYSSGFFHGNLIKVMKIDLINTADGSNTLYVPSLNEQFHSLHGAITESMHVYINSALKLVNKKEISIFEIGFGTGLNAYLSAIFAFENDKSIFYYSIDNQIIDNKIIELLNYPEIINKNQDIFYLIHKAKWNNTEKIHNNFFLNKILYNILDYDFNLNADIIFYDAFCPKVQPELWTFDILKKVTSMLLTEGIFVTYSSKGSVKRDLQLIGLKVEKIPGPQGKKEIIRAFRK